MINITTLDQEDNEEVNDRQMNFENSIDEADIRYDRIQEGIDRDLKYWNETFADICKRLVSTGGPLNATLIK